MNRAFTEVSQSSDSKKWETITTFVRVSQPGNLGISRQRLVNPVVYTTNMKVVSSAVSKADNSHVCFPTLNVVSSERSGWIAGLLSALDVKWLSYNTSLDMDGFVPAAMYPSLVTYVPWRRQKNSQSADYSPFWTFPDIFKVRANSTKRFIVPVQHAGNIYLHFLPSCCLITLVLTAN